MKWMPFVWDDFVDTFEIDPSCRHSRMSGGWETKNDDELPLGFRDEGIDTMCLWYVPRYQVFVAPLGDVLAEEYEVTYYALIPPVPE